MWETVPESMNQVLGQSSELEEGKGLKKQSRQIILKNYVKMPAINSANWSYFCRNRLLISSSASSFVFISALCSKRRILSSALTVSKSTKSGWSRSWGHWYSSWWGGGRLSTFPLTSVAIAYAAVLCQNLENSTAEIVKAQWIHWLSVKSIVHLVMCEKC